MELPDSVGKGTFGGNAPRVTIYVKFDGNRVAKASFQTFGCGFTIAACSALTEWVGGRTINECLKVSSKDLIASLDGMPADKAHCAQVVVDALRDALQQRTETGIGTSTR